MFRLSTPATASLQRSTWSLPIAMTNGSRKRLSRFSFHQRMWRLAIACTTRQVPCACCDRVRVLVDGGVGGGSATVRAKASENYLHVEHLEAVLLAARQCQLVRAFGIHTRRVPHPTQCRW